MICLLGCTTTCVLSVESSLRGEFVGEPYNAKELFDFGSPIPNRVRCTDL